MSLDAACLVKESELLTELGIGATTPRVERLALGISQRIERFLGYSLARKTFTEEAPDLLQGRGDQWLQLTAATVESIESILIDGDTVDDFQRLTDADAKGRLFREFGWPRAVGCEPLVGYPNDNRRYNISAIYTGGYWLPNAGVKPSEALALPADLQEVAMGEILVAYRNPDRTRVMTAETTAGGWKRVYGNATKTDGGSHGLSCDSIRILGPLRRRWFGHA